jgi:uracil-DNA glycosylase family 4
VSPRAPTLAVVRREIIDCERCPRLREYCERVAREKKRAYRDETYWGRPVPGFGDPRARLLIVGLAPGAHGANRTGRMFTGDSSGDFLAGALCRAGFANQPTSRHARDGLALRDAYIVAAIRCAPPDNKPLPIEIERCRVHLNRESAALPKVKVVVALGKIAFDAFLALRAEQGAPARPKPRFFHGASYDLAGGPRLIASYHPSQQNTNTGRLTAEMFDAIFRDAARALES